MEIRTGLSIGRYLLIEELYSDGISITYKAEDTRLKSLVTIKLIMRSRGYSSAFTQVFLRQAHDLAQLTHPNIARILDYGQEQGYLYLVTEWVEGEPLRKRLTGPVEWPAAVEWIIELARTLEVAHKKNIIHRDIKPENILLDEDGHITLTDFGITRIIEEEETRDVTGTNVGLGSPYYMSPEQGLGHPVDHRADIYALGVVFFELVTGHKPYEAESGMEVVIQQITSAPPSPRIYQSRLPEAIVRIILKSLNKDPLNRYQSMAELAEAVEQVLDKNKAKSHRIHQALQVRPGIYLAGIVFVFLALWGIRLLISKEPPADDPSPVPVSQQPTDRPTLLEMAAVSSEIVPAVNTAAPDTREGQETAAPTPADPGEETRYPIAEGEPLPDLAPGGISVENVSSLRELARWGRPKVYTILWSLDDRQIIGGTSGGVFFYSAVDLHVQSVLDTQSEVTALAISPDGSMLATGSLDGTIKVWGYETHNLLQVFNTPWEDWGGKPSRRINSLAFSPDNSWLASASDDKSAWVWPIQPNREPKQFLGHTFRVNSVAFLPDGNHLVTGSDDVTVRVWDIVTGEAAIYTHMSQVYDLAVSSEKSLLAAGIKFMKGKKYGTLVLWDLSAGELANQRTISDVTQLGAVTSLDFSRPNNERIATGSEDGKVRIFSLKGDQLMTLSLPEVPNQPASKDNSIIKVAYSNRNSRLASLTDEGRISIWQTSNYDLDVDIFLRYAAIQRVAISPDRRFTAFQTAKEEVIVQSLEDGKVLFQVNGWLPAGQPFSSDSHWIAVWGSQGSVDLYLVDSFIPIRTVIFSGAPLIRGPVAFLANDQLFATAGSRNIRIWSVSSQRELELSVKVDPTGRECQAAFQREGEFLASGSSNGIFTSTAAAALFCQIPREVRVEDGTFEQQNQAMAFGLDNGTIQVWAWRDNSYLLKSVRDGTAPINAVALSPDGSLLVTGNQLGIMKFWKTADLSESGMAFSHQRSINDISISEDGQLMVTVADDGLVSVWGLLP